MGSSVSRVLPSLCRALTLKGMLKNFSREGKKSFVWGKKRRVSGQIAGCVIFLFIFFFPCCIAGSVGFDAVVAHLGCRRPSAGRWAEG